MIHEKEGHSVAELWLSLPEGSRLNRRELVPLVGRKGDALGSGKVLDVSQEEGWVRVEVPSHLAWEARGVRKGRSSLEDEWALSAEKTAASKVEVLLQGERRMLRQGQPLALSLLKRGLARGDDRLLCRDGSCGRCEIRVDGIKRLACRTQVHRGMSIELLGPEDSAGKSQAAPDPELLCPCSGVSASKVVEKIRDGKLRSPNSIRQACGVGEGACRGRACVGAFRRILEREGVQSVNWIDWRFPWSDWTISI
jgi:bacterioferritin-associated ferredoxin